MPHEVLADEEPQPNKESTMPGVKVDNGVFTQKEAQKNGSWKMEFMAYKDIKCMQIVVGMHLVGKPNQAYPYGQVAKAAPITLNVIPQEELYGATEEEPFLRLGYEAATALMDELWGCGIRPTEVGSQGELGATKSHLEDMRKIVFQVLDLKK